MEAMNISRITIYKKITSTVSKANSPIKTAARSAMIVEGIIDLRTTPRRYPITIERLGCGVSKMPVKVPLSFCPAITFVPVLIDE